MRKLLARFGLVALVASVLIPIASRPAFALVSIDGAGST